MTAAIHSTLVLTLLCIAAATSAQTTQSAPMKIGGDQMAHGFQAPTVERNYDRRVVMVPMRDGVKLYTVIVVPKGAHDAPILLTRTPYNAAARAAARSTQRTHDRELCRSAMKALWRLATSACIRMCAASTAPREPYLMTPPPVDSGLQPHRRRRHDRCLGHHRLAGEERAGDRTAASA